MSSPSMKFGMKLRDALIIDPAHDFLRSEYQPLDEFFKPKSVAVVGASERTGSVGRQVMWNLLATPFGGVVYPVNSMRDAVMGVRAYKDLKSLPERVDVVVVTTPAATVPPIIDEAAELGIPTAIVISAGFKEHGEQGKALERRLAETVARSKMRLIGPNCLGVMNPVTGFNATFAHAAARPGNVAFISQSGALCTAVLDWSLTENIGFSGFVSIGSMLDVNFGDLIQYFGNDPRTSSIVIYMETVGDASSFLSAAREVSLVKPIIVIKAGRTAAAAKAAASHTGSLTGSDEVLEAAFRRCGVLRVNRIHDIFYMSEVLARQPRPAGPRLCIVTNAGGPGVLATDALISGGGSLAELSPVTLRALDQILPPHWSHGNPVDILGDAEPERYSKSLEIVAKDPNIDGMLVILTPQGMTNPTGIAEHLRPYAKILGKPVVASWMGGTLVKAGEEILNQIGIPTFAYPDSAADAFNYICQYNDNLRSLYETPSLRTEEEIDRASANRIIKGVREKNRTILTEFESKELLKAYGIPTVETRIAETVDAAVAAANEIGYPVVLKLYSETITHKTDVGGVQLNLRNEGAVREAFSLIQTSVTKKVGAQHFLGVTVQQMIKPDGYEVILGSSIDEQFGPVLLFGSGGQLVEVYKDHALGLPPLNSTLARRMMEQTKIYHALKGVRGRQAIDIFRLEEIMVRFSQLVVENPWISELDINPLLASPERIVALDARVVLHDASIPEEKLPHSAIRPYPIEYISGFQLDDGEQITIRPIRPEDEPLISDFHGRLSDRTVHMRYFRPMPLHTRTAHERLLRICFIDYVREMALVAEKRRPDGTAAILGVTRISKQHDGKTGEVMLVVRDDYQSRGIGAELMARTVEVARAEKLNKLIAHILVENEEMQGLINKLGFSVKPLDDQVVRGELDLAPREEEASEVVVP
jgi:acetyltransferase